MDLFQKIKLMENNYANTEAKVYQTIAKNPRMVDLYTITGLAAQADTSTSAVRRFCQTLGYRDYKDFRADMVQYLRKQSETTPTAWYMLKRIRAAMGQREKKYQLSGVIEFDDFYFGGPTVGQKRGAVQKKRKYLWHCLWTN